MIIKYIKKSVLFVLLYFLIQGCNGKKLDYKNYQFVISQIIIDNKIYKHRIDSIVNNYADSINNNDFPIPNFIKNACIEYDVINETKTVTIYPIKEMISKRILNKRRLKQILEIEEIKIECGRKMEFFGYDSNYVDKSFFYYLKKRYEEL